MLWTRSFLEEQGHKVNSITVYQDNKSAFLLEENGKGSSSKRTRHRDIRYFFITDRITAGKISLEYCPTNEMIADFYTKPLQVNMFTKYRNLILNDNHKQGISLSTKQREDPRSMLSKQVKKILGKQVSEDEKYTGADTNRFPTARGLELSRESSIVENTQVNDFNRLTINNFNKFELLHFEL